jgi:hypothetical protein
MKLLQKWFNTEQRTKSFVHYLVTEVIDRMNDNRYGAQPDQSC